MKRETLDIAGLRPLALLNGVEFCDGRVTIEHSSERNRSGLVVTEDIDEEHAILVRVPPDLVLSLETVWVYAKSDRHLNELLEATGEFSRDPKNAIRLFLLLQMTHGISDGVIGVGNFFSIYIKYLPKRFDLPSLWDVTELRLLQGTSLDIAMKAKLEILDDEFTTLRDSTKSIEWCQKYWWDADTGDLTIHDWKVLDAMYRSRAMDLPGIGSATVPIMDMANHAEGARACASYDIDPDGNGILWLSKSIKLKRNDEIIISYGDDNGASEMLYSYGFIESTMSSAKELWLELDVPEDDPLRHAKRYAANSSVNSAPGFKILEKSGSIDSDPQSKEPLTPSQICWEGAWVWLVNVNEEDGLKLKVLRTNDGDEKIIMSWKGQVMDSDFLNLESLLLQDPRYEIFKLRVITMMQQRISVQLLRLEESKKDVADIIEITGGRSANHHTAIRLRDLEERLMLRAYEQFGSQQAELLELPVVQEYLRRMQKDVQEEIVTEDDFA